MGTKGNKTDGWVCPKCDNVYGPHVDECVNCNGVRFIPYYPPYPYVPTIPWRPYEPYVPYEPWRITYWDGTTSDTSGATTVDGDIGFSSEQIDRETLGMITAWDNTAPHTLTTA